MLQVLRSPRTYDEPEKICALTSVRIRCGIVELELPVRARRFTDVSLPLFPKENPKVSPG